VETGAHRPVPGTPAGDVVSGEPSRPARWRVEVSADCLGSGMCVVTARRHFQLVDGHSHARHGEVEPDDAVIAAAQLCPMSAITVFDADTGDEVAPLS
jgi:ferredoxin